MVKVIIDKIHKNCKGYSAINGQIHESKISMCVRARPRISSSKSISSWQSMKFFSYQETPCHE